MLICFSLTKTALRRCFSFVRNQKNGTMFRFYDKNEPLSGSMSAGISFAFSVLYSIFFSTLSYQIRISVPSSASRNTISIGILHCSISSNICFDVSAITVNPVSLSTVNYPDLRKALKSELPCFADPGYCHTYPAVFPGSPQAYEFGRVPCLLYIICLRL